MLRASHVQITSTVMLASTSSNGPSDITETSSDDGTEDIRKFRFPPAPRLCKSANNTSCSVSCHSDSSASDCNLVQVKKRNRRRHAIPLPPIGVFWDIENCQVPKNKSASSIVQKIREIFFVGYREAEFIVVCDVKKENAQIIQDLHDAQVNLIHVSSTSKNAADEKLRQSLRRFAEAHPAPSAVVLISGDINFAGDLSDLRYRKKIHVVLVHSCNAADALILCANETYTYSCLTENLPMLKAKPSCQYSIDISNLPVNYDRKKLKNRLKWLSDNCGGKVVHIDISHGTAVLRFSSYDFAIRAQRRLKDEDVFGYKIRLSNPTTVRDSPRNFTTRKPKGVDSSQSFMSTSAPTFQDGGIYSSSNGHNNSRDTWKNVQESGGRQSLLPQENLFRPIKPQAMVTDQFDFWGSQFGSGGSFGDFRSTTPQDDMNGACGVSFDSKLNRSSRSFIPEDDSKLYQNFRGNQNQSTSSQPVELIISSLDPSIDLKDLKKVLTNLLKEFVMLVSLNITLQADGSPVATVRVATQQQAQYAISQLQHYKLGFKRLTISYAQNNSLDTSQLRDMVLGLFQEVPGNRLPLFKLIELLESRYHVNVSVSEISKLKDVIRITDDDYQCGRIISLAPEYRSSPSSGLNRVSMLYCSLHCPNGVENRGWGEADAPQLPNIRMSLTVFSSKVNTLLSHHMGVLPLLSFPVCYLAEFGEPLITDEQGVPLEHLVTCIGSIELKLGGPNNNIKYISREVGSTSYDSEKEELKSAPTSITSNVQLLCRELVDLLKTTEKCQLPLSRFIPAYHHHFGRQCRVADYGYVKLIDLLQSQPIANVVQIMGDGTRRNITLTHPTQMRRFTSDLLRVLKGQPSKQLSVQDFPTAYERIMGKGFNSVEYGLCNLEDLLDEVPEHIVVITKTPNSGVSISIPKREQTAEEIVRTKQFAEEVVKLLCHSPQCMMQFNRFVPAYHHHFGHQCRVSDYGFSKLIELFESIPDTVRVEELSDGERYVFLTPQRAIKVLGQQVTNIIRTSDLSSLPLEALCGRYLEEYGCPLRPQTYDCQNIQELLDKLSDFIWVSHSSAGKLLVLVDSDNNPVLMKRVWGLLIHPPHRMNASVLINQYRIKFESNISIGKLERFTDVVSLITENEQYAQLTPRFTLASQLYLMIYRAGGQVAYNNLESMYRRTFEKGIVYSDFDMSSMEDMLLQLNFVVLIRGSRKRTSIVLNPMLTEYGIPLPSVNNSSENNKFFKKEGFLPSWPPPPAHDLVSGAHRRRVTPPKPDTPPAAGSSPWNTWSTPTKFNTSIDLSIPMPAAQTPKLMGNVVDTLISPTKNLLPAHPHSLGSVLPMITPPLPTELPMPDKLLGKDDSNDSGLVNLSNMNSENEMDTSSEQTGAKPKFGSSMNKSYVSYNT